MIDQYSPSNYLAALVGDLGSNLVLYQTLEETVNGLLIVDKRHKVLYGNPVACRFMEVAYGELAGVKLSGLFGECEADLNEIFGDHSPMLSEEYGSSPKRFEITLKKWNASKRTVEAAFVRPKKNPDYYLVYLIDITQRKNLEVELRHSNAFFHNLIGSSVDGIIAADTKGNIILFNQGAQDLLGYTREEALADLHVTRLYPDNEAYEIIQRMRSDEYGGKGKLIRHELLCNDKAGNTIPMSLSGGIIYDNDKEVATFGIFTDLRAIQKIEEDLQQTHQLLQQSEKMAGLGRLAAGVAHEINNPMSGIMLYANLVKEDLGEDHNLIKDVDTIIHEAERCKVIVADLLEFSHQNAYDMEEVDVNEQILRTLGLLENQAFFHNIEIKLSLDEDLSRIRGNAVKLNQVFMNTFVNAAQAMDGEGQLSIISRHRSNRDIVEVLIRDTGPGIPPQTLTRIFDPFFTTKKTGEGTGLGLSVSYAIVKEHKGTIRATSTLGEGTMFTLRLPISQPIPVGEET